MLNCVAAAVICMLCSIGQYTGVTLREQFVYDVTDAANRTTKPALVTIDVCKCMLQSHANHKPAFLHMCGSLPKAGSSE